MSDEPRPGPDEANRQLALARQADLAGDTEGAQAGYRRVLDTDPGHPVALSLLGELAGRSGRFDEAVELLGRALERAPQSAPIHSLLGYAWRAAGKPARAETSFLASLRHDPASADALNNLGILSEELGRPQEAEERFRAALRIRPDFADALGNLGVWMHRRARFDEAIGLFRRALALNPGSAAAHFNLANALKDSGAFDAALESYARALEHDPADLSTRWNGTLVHLLRGRWQANWDSYETRWELAENLAEAARWRASAAPRWDGGDPFGKTILLHAEQGYGDTLQFARYAALLARRGARVVLECQPPLKRLLAGMPGVSRVLAAGEPLPAYDVHCPLLSLPGLFETSPDSVPAEIPYLAADEKLSAHWREKMPGGASGIRVGLAWSGRPGHRDDINRSIPLERFAPLAGMAGVTWYSLQLGGRSADSALRMIDLTGGIADFADTAALVTNLDLVISVDTAVADLAGALGVPVWTLLPFVPDWRWLLGREDSPWYPTMRLFRQQRPRDWDGVIGAVVAALGVIAAAPLALRRSTP